MNCFLQIPIAVVVAVFALLSDANAACIEIKNVNQLQRMQNNLAGNYCLASDIDASSKPNFVPVGDQLTPFTGTFTGRGFTIRNLTIRSARQHVGLFGVARAAVIQNVTLQNINVRASGNFSSLGVGALVGQASSDAPDSITIARVHVSGLVRCLAANCDAGGIAGQFGSTTGNNALRDSSSAATVISTRYVGGAIGFPVNTTIQRSYATGAVTCTGTECAAGGLVGRFQGGLALDTFATGPVTAAGSGFTRAGGLIALAETAFGIGTNVQRSFASGPVMIGTSGLAGALIAQLNGAECSAEQTYAIGPVSGTGATTRGLIASAGGGPSVTSSYWDTETTGQTMSAAGTALTTAQLRADLPAGFGPAWGITKTYSYPFRAAPQIDFLSPLATLVRQDAGVDKVFVFLPIGQLDAAQYLAPPENADEASLAAVYAMIARAIGIAQDVNNLKNVAIDRYFWDDATRKTTFKGPIKSYATLGPFAAIPAASPLDAANVIGVMNTRDSVVILRGRYNRDGNAVAHWMLGTLYIDDGTGTPLAIIAHDPWTGRQVRIDPVTKRVVAPADFPLAGFKINGYRAVKLISPPPVTLTPASRLIAPGATTSFRVTLDAPRQSSTNVPLSVAPASGVVPATITVPAGSKSVQFDYTDTSGNGAVITATVDSSHTATASVIVAGSGKFLAVQENGAAGP